MRQRHLCHRLRVGLTVTPVSAERGLASLPSQYQPGNHCTQQSWAFSRGHEDVLDEGILRDCFSCYYGSAWNVA